MLSFLSAPIEPVRGPNLTCDGRERDTDTHLAWCSDHYKGYETPWQILSAIHLVESGRQKVQRKRSYAGATGPMQFMPATWQGYCPEMNIRDLKDSITCADRYLQANYNKSGSWYQAIWQYNHADWYVRKILNEAKIMGFNN